MFRTRWQGAILAMALLAALLPRPAAAQSLIRDAEIERTLGMIAHPLLRTAGMAPGQVDIYILNDPEPGAFVAGGNNIFLHTGLLRELDFVIGNEHEWCALYETDDLGAALEQAAYESGLIVCTRSGHDVVLVEGEETVTVPVHAATPVDTTGAGDQFAAGFLYGLATGKPLAVAGRMGCIAAAEVIGHYGARPEADVRSLFAAEGLI